MEYLTSPWTWLGFSIFLVMALSIDTFLIGKFRARSEETWRAALFWTIFWVSCSLVFSALLWCFLYIETDVVTANFYALNFLTAWLVEKSLSLDNLFVFYLIFQHFKVPARHQHRVLSYGIWGAVIMRLGVIVGGIWLISMFHWVLYLMGAFLLFTGLKIFIAKDDEKFFVRKNLLLYATPLFVTLVLIEFSDLIFASDSIPAVLAISRDPFIVWSSNVFAILGLRAMYFLLARMVHELEFLKYGIGLILVYVGVKMLIEPWVDIPAGISLSIIGSIILIFSLLSVWIQRLRAKS